MSKRTRQYIGILFAIVFSMLLGIAAVLFLALTGETYATALAFLLLVLKAGLYMKGR